jgi:ABC-2 type transport system permease protein
MFDLYRADARRLATTRTSWGLLLGAIAVVVIGTFSTISSMDPIHISGAMHDQPFYLLTSVNLGVFAVVFGIRIFTDEFRHGTIVPAALVTTSRRRLFLGKAVVAAMATAVGSAIALLAMVATAIATASMKGASLGVVSDDIGAFAGLIVGMAAWSAIGVAIGGIVRHQVAAIVGGVIWTLVAENLASGLVGNASAFLPGQSVHALADATQATGLATPTAALAVLAVYVLALGLGAVVSLERRDLA